MQQLQAHTSGVEVFDALIDGVQDGDNLVLVVSGGAPAAWLVDRFVATSDPDRLIVADTTDRHGRTAAHAVLAWGATDDVTGPAAAQARRELTEADGRVGTGARVVVDSLSDLAGRWGDAAALDLFLWACPRLYRRQSIALWIIDRDRRDDAFMRRLTEITQVVVAARPVEDGLRLEVLKADGRSSAVQGRTVDARLVDGHLQDARPADVERERLGQTLRRLRTSKGVGQAELARRAGISPSALSQAERGVRGVSAETLVRLWEALGMPVSEDHPSAQGYRINRRGGLTTATVTAGVSGRRLADDSAATVWHLTVAPRASGRGPLFAVKAVETVTVWRGILQLDLDGHTETLQEGDTLVAQTAAVTAWTNPADTDAEVLWIIST